MFSLSDVKFVALTQYDIYTDNGNYTYPRENLVEMIIDIIDTFYLLENIKSKENELLLMMDENE